MLPSGELISIGVIGRGVDPSRSEVTAKRYPEYSQETCRLPRNAAGNNVSQRQAAITNARHDGCGHGLLIHTPTLAMTVQI